MAYIALFWIVVIVVAAGIAARCNFRHWRQTRGRPLILASGSELVHLTPQWPLPEGQWPRPDANSDQPMHPMVAACYASLSGRRILHARGIGQAVITVGGVWLGLGIPALGRYLAASPRRLPLWESQVQLLMHSIPMLVIALGIWFIVYRAAQYEQARSVYRQAAQPSPTQPVQTRPRQRWWSFLLGSR